MSSSILFKVILILLVAVIAFKLILPLVFGITIFLIKVGVLAAIGAGAYYVVKKVLGKK